ncbi:MAG: 50S ribosomal protein L10 [Verrucomicrobia bacterium]|nr:50S ribosomal protein L10 [Verrucomicrobiota bacterium]
MKEEKSIMIDHLLQKVNASPFMFVVDYGGLTVDKFEELRKRLRGAGAELHVYKNTLVKKAAERAQLPAELGAVLTGQTAIVTGEKDVCATAKVMKTFSSEFERPKMKAGVLDGKYLTPDGIKVLADLPAREVLLAQLLGVLQAPASQLVRLLNEPAASLARVIQAKGDQAA